MPELPEKRLLALLKAQRSAEVRRATTSRGSQAWLGASADLDDLNEQIMHLASFGTSRIEPVEVGLDIDLLTNPDDDLVFRSSVLRCIREAASASALDRLTTASLARLTLSEAQIRRSLELLKAATPSLRKAYPDAVLGTHEDAEDGSVGVRADRNGEVA